MQQQKKKVGFDMDPEVLSNLKLYCEEKDIKISNFYREAVEEKLSRDEELAIIYLPFEGTIQKVAVQMANYEIDFFGASDAMRENVGAVNQGVLQIKDGKKESNLLLSKLLAQDKKIIFFTKTQYAPTLAQNINQTTIPSTLGTMHNEDAMHSLKTSQ